MFYRDADGSGFTRQWRNLDGFDSTHAYFVDFDGDGTGSIMVVNTGTYGGNPNGGTSGAEYFFPDASGRDGFDMG